MKRIVREELKKIISIPYRLATNRALFPL